MWFRQKAVWVVWGFAPFIVFALSGCGGDGDPHVVSQVAARVGSYEITVHQVNASLARLGSIAAGQAADAGSRVLERLIDQELLVAQAREQKIDRDPAVMAAIDAAQREIVARAFLERVTSQAGRPEAAEVTAFYKDNPGLFARRRIYALQELAIVVPPERHDVIRSAISRASSLEEMAGWLRRENIAFTPGGGLKAAEDLPLDALAHVAAMRDGQTEVLGTPEGLLVVHLAGSREAPLDETSARPLIERFLGNRAREAQARDELRRLRESVPVEYVGDFASPAAARAVAADPALSPTALGKGAAGLK